MSHRALLTVALFCFAVVIRVDANPIVLLGNDPSSTGSQQDLWTRNLFVNKSAIHTNLSEQVERVTIESFQLYVGRNRGRVTPFIVRVHGDSKFKVIAIGTTRVSGTDYRATGAHKFPFSEPAPVLLLAPGTTIATGVTDANPDGSGNGAGGVIPYDPGGDRL